MQRNYRPAPDPSVLFYQRNLDSGKKEVATIQSLTTNENGAWRALFRVPGQAEFIMDQFNSELENWEPIYALTQADISTLIERIAQRVTELMQHLPPSKTVTAAMGVLQSETVQEAVAKASEVVPVIDPYSMPVIFACSCGKGYKYEKSFKKHKRKCQVK
jgi:hypothetical protein